MFNYVISASIRNRVIVLAVAAILVVYGAITARDLHVDVFPHLNRSVVTIMAEAEGLAPEEVELFVSFPLETAMNGAPGVTRVRSVSAQGLSIVFVEFDWGTDVNVNRQYVTERLTLITDQVPDGVRPTMMPISSIMGEIVLVAVTSETLSPMDVRDFADWVMRPRLLTIPGVSQVIGIGGEVRQIRVTPDTVAMSNLGITVEGLSQSLRRFGTNAAGGFVDQHSREFLIRNVNRTLDLEDLRNLVIGYREGAPLLLKAVASVEIAPRVRRGDAGYDGKPAVILAIQKQPGADTLRVTRDVEATLEQLQRTAPAGLVANRVLFRQADFINRSVQNVRRVLIEALIVVSIVLFFFLMNARTTLISLTAIPISVCITILIFYMFGLSVNTMTLGGLAIAIGELVDDAVVDVENIFRRLKENRKLADPKPVMSVVVSASQEVRSGIVYATLIIVLVFVPLFALPGLEGWLFAPLGIAYVVSILASMIVSITVTPVLAFYLLPRMRTLTKPEGRWLTRLRAANRSAVSFALDHPRRLMGCVLAAVVASVAVGVSLPRVFLPPFNEGSVTVNLVANPGISLAESVRLATVAEHLVRQVPEVISVGRRTGRAELDEHAEGVHSSELEVALRDLGRSRADVLRDIRQQIAALPLRANVGQPISHRLDHLLSGVRAEIVVKVVGDDLGQLRSLAAEIEQRMASIAGMSDLATEKQVLIPQLQIILDHGLAAAFSVQPSSAAEAIERLSNGQRVSHLVDGTRRVEIVLRLADANRTTDAIGRLMIESPAGATPLSSFTRIEERYGPNQILRENARRRIVVMANSDGTRAMSDIAADLRAAIAGLEMPPGYFVSLEGTFRAQEEAMKRIALLAGISVALIFAVLYSRYRSATLALVVMANIPLALIGSVVALWLSGQPLSVASMVGFITLAGISARNGILKISHFINLVLREGETFGRDLILRGSNERLLPVLMTAISASLALLPLMGNPEAPGMEVLYPVAVVIFGGLMSSTLLDTLLTPVLFSRYGQSALARLQKEQGAKAEAEAF
jgi:HME family heavy-metal exporter